MSSKGERPKIAVGSRAGHLTVEARTSETRGGYSVWRCRCSCGGEILLDTRCLQRGTVRDCGCITKVKPGQRDLTDRRFGMLTCLEPTDQRSPEGSVIWRCRCDCGRECLLPGSLLLSGNRKSCGCLAHPPLKDYVGRRFGELTVTEYAGKTGGVHRWRCLCDCGAETVVGQTQLQSGKTKSCGCLQAKTLKENLELWEGTSVARLRSGKNRLLSSNTSGYTGIYQNKRSGKWIAQITFKGKTYYLGCYDKKEDAIKARLRGEELHDDFLEWYSHRDREAAGLSGK